MEAESSMTITTLRRSGDGVDAGKAHGLGEGEGEERESGSDAGT